MNPCASDPKPYSSSCLENGFSEVLMRDAPLSQGCHHTDTYRPHLPWKRRKCQMPVSPSRVGPPLQTASFERFAGACAILTAIAAFLYALAFVLVQEELLS